VLAEAVADAERLGGTLFAVGQATGAIYRGHAGSGHVDSRIFCAVNRLHLFDHPLPLTQLERHVRLTPASAITPVTGSALVGLRDELAIENTLPEYLARAVPGRGGLREVTAATWRAIALAPRTRFLHEQQLRVYLLDYLLAELKDAGTPVLRECQAVRDNRPTGIADYLISLDGRWLPVEAKLSIAVEPGLIAQVGQYQRVDAFIPQHDPHCGRRFTVPRQDGCLVADQAGLYLIQGDRFIGAPPGCPLFDRTAIAEQTPADLKRALMTLLRQ
jgi:hypothetical protein